ncbi:MAG: helix-turn-helix domain-containing protein [Acidimicrobiia bacterium]
MSDQAPSEAVLTAEQAAQLLKVSTKTVLRLARQGELPAHKVGRSWRFSRAALLGCLDRGPVDGGGHSE